MHIDVARQHEVANSLVCDNAHNKLLLFPYNEVKLVQSNAQIDTYWGILQAGDGIKCRIGLVSFPLPEYLCFAGAAEEVYEVLVSSHENKLRSLCRLDNDFVEVVYRNHESYSQFFGLPSKVREYRDREIPHADKYTVAFLKSFFTVALPLPTVNDAVADTAIRRSALRVAVTALNHFADCHRRFVGIPWASVPHYSFFTFPYGYIREYGIDGIFIESAKYLMNPATGVLPQRPYCIDPDGSKLRTFTASLLSDPDPAPELNLFRKGEAYSGHGHDLAGIRLCVSAVDAILRRWAQQKGVNPGGDPPNKARLKSLLGKFEAQMKSRRLVEAPDKFIQEVKDAINLRHSMEHESLQVIDSTTLFPAIEVLRRFFDIVSKEVA